MSSNPPTLDDTTLPTPSKEWADQAHAALTPDNGTQPGIDVPGAFPPEESIYPQTQSQAKPPLERAASGEGVKDKVHHTAENYIAPERLDQAEHFVEGVGSKAAQYVPAGVASVVSSYWCEWKSSRSRSGTVSVPSSSSASKSKSMSESDVSSTTSSMTERPPQASALWTGVGWLIVGTAWLIWGDGTSKSSASNTSAGADSGANGNGTTSHPIIEKDSAQPSSVEDVWSVDADLFCTCFCRRLCWERWDYSYFRFDVGFLCKTARCGRCSDEDFYSGAGTGTSTNPSTGTSFSDSPVIRTYNRSTCRGVHYSF
ncbi:hypothetical protein PILCRDRAFT_192114 [Piloderma croceum F 1598]|uniref:Uncharacterized protein n=1 Tax=Piloderma croceum (strain F 1598) TaxID=765440 RepID=A0A0C3BT02_PILCF|nr:hypothetical protein PILCRDRAFT_192114 [Piloderma croceum F 1598]